MFPIFNKIFSSFSPVNFLSNHLAAPTSYVFNALQILGKVSVRCLTQMESLNSRICANVDDHTARKILTLGVLSFGLLASRYIIQDRQAASQVESLITDNMGWTDRVAMRQLIKEVPEKQRDQVVAQAKSLITDNMNGTEKFGILNSIKKIPEKQRDHS